MTTDKKSTTGAGEAPDCLTVALENFLSYLHAEENKRNEILNLLRDLQGDMRDLHERLEAVERTVNATLAYVTQEEIDGNVDPHDQAQAGKTNFNDLKMDIKRRYDAIVYHVSGRIFPTGNLSKGLSAVEWSETLKNTVDAVWKKTSANDGVCSLGACEQWLKEIKALVDDWERDSGCEVKPFWPESYVAMGAAVWEDSDGIKDREVATKVQDAIWDMEYKRRRMVWPGYESLAEAEKARHIVDFCLLPALISKSSQSTRVIVPAQVVVRSSRQSAGANGKGISGGF